jgi:hypothetical protein
VKCGIEFSSIFKYSENLITVMIVATAIQNLQTFLKADHDGVKLPYGSDKPTQNGPLPLK